MKPLEDFPMLLPILAVLAIPEGLKLPAKLNPPLTAEAIGVSNEALEAVAWPYAIQIANLLVVSSSVTDAIKVAKNNFGNVPNSLPLKDLYFSCPALQEEILGWEETLAEAHSWENKAKPALFMGNKQSPLVTKVEVTVRKSKIKAVLDTGAPMLVISTKLAKHLKLAPDIDYNK